MVRYYYKVGETKYFRSRHILELIFLLFLQHFTFICLQTRKKYQYWTEVFLNFADQLVIASTFKNIFGRNKVAHTLILFFKHKHYFKFMDSVQK